MPSDCVFHLNKAIPTYFSGETISGNIILRTTSNKNVRDVCIIFFGEGKVKWSESHSTTNTDGSSSSSTTQYRSNETYVNNSTCVHGEGVLAAGTHTYAFSIPLPLECPSSCEGKYGHIRYEIVLKINRYYRIDNVYKKPITIIKTVDLNWNPMYKIPMELATSSNPSFWPFSKGKIFCTLKIPFGAYASGQMVNYALHIANQSMSDCEGYRLEFSQKIIFTARSPNHKERTSKNTLISRSIPDKCLRLTNRILKGEFLIPATPSTTDKSSIICVQYTLKFTIQLSAWTSNPDLKVPIIIGTIPIIESLPTNQQVSPSATELSMPSQHRAGNDLPPRWNEKNTPTCEEVTSASAPPLDDTDEKKSYSEYSATLTRLQYS